MRPWNNCDIIHREYKMKILHIAHITNSPFSGVCSVVPEYLKSQQNKAEVALLNVKGEIIHDVQHCFIYKNSWKKSVSLEFRNPDIVVFHEVYYWNFVKIARSLLRENIPYIIIPHGCLVKEALQRKWLKKFTANLLFFNKFIKNAKAIQCLSDKELKNTTFTVPKFVCTNGINIPNSSKQKFHLEKLVITYIGRLEIHVKGLDILIMAVNNISKVLKNKNVQINIYGPDANGMYARLKSMITNYHLSDIIFLHHEISGKEKEKILYNSDIFIQTSRHEGMPMGILEAMGIGLPCLVTRGTSLGEIIEKYNAGWVSDTTVESLSQSILNAVSQNNSLEIKSQNARCLIEDNFTWEKITNQTFRVYKSIIQNK